MCAEALFAGLRLDLGDVLEGADVKVLSHA
jgi:hypothetical protein